MAQVDTFGLYVAGRLEDWGIDRGVHPAWPVAALFILTIIAAGLVP